MDIIASVGSSFTSCLCKPNHATTEAVEQRQHMINTAEGARRLGKMKMKLLSQVVVVKAMLQKNEKEKRASHSNIQKWLDDVKDIMAKTEAIEQEIRIVRKGLRVLLRDCCSYSNLDQRISKLIEEVSALSEAGSKLSGESTGRPVSNTGMELPTRKIVGELRAKKTLEMVWKCLIYDESWGIGVWGMGGVGKTTIMKVINNRLVKEEQHFSKVIWVTITKNMNVRRLQDEIAKKAGITISHIQAEVERSSLLRDELSAMGRIVLILDDIWVAFPLHQIGIPHFTGDHGSKLVLISRSLDVCQKMGCKKNIKVEILLEEEAWELFSGTVGMKLSTEVENIAKDIAKECSGLPLAILTIARAMTGKEDIRAWRIALRNLRESTSSMNTENRVISILKFSYDNLGDDILKSCFLYCALYPGGWKILSKELVNYWIMDGLIEEKSMQGELDRGEIILNELKHNGLLESVDINFDDYQEWGEGVRMHRFFRDMAIQIASHRFISKCDLMLKDLENEAYFEETLEGASFMSNNIRKLSISPTCPRLSTLFLNKNPDLSRIMDPFFVHLKGLKILDLRDNSSIESLPDSMSDLVELRALRLSRCLSLKKVPSVAKLLSLKMMELDETNVEELPQGIEFLVNLRLLNLHSLSLREGVLSEFVSRIDLSQLDLQF